MSLVAFARETEAFTILQRDGIVPVFPFPPQAVDQVNAWLDDCVRWGGHVKRQGDSPINRPITCWAMHDVMVAPHLWEWALSLTPFAEAYLDAPALLYSINAFESTPHDWAPHPGIERFHRDNDDTKFLAAFLYLTDVGADGAHRYQCGTHEGWPLTRIEDMTGRRGTAFLADTRGYHCGGRPTTGPRRLAWVRWGVSDPPASYIKDCLSPLPKAQLGGRYPTDPALQRAIHLVAA